MPHLHLLTNVSQDSFTDGFISETSKLLAQTLGKPESYCCFTVQQVHGAFGGSNKKFGSARLMSIGCLGVKENQKHSATLSKHFEKHLGIPSDRLYFEFVDAKPADVGYNGTTFHAIFGGH
ncbi:unnamed protein product [Darwinula stevensoni]|uniref:L-dopachrome isomerase n=1 Tax=Darwinula stevensoni TaxID=69355 RepID=A0A7R8WYS1_9CRUS|nr:unnamed protein product [Darwinula stevensoni]CAG0879260.1 unnamed protein product [Darwinula stevensoni]